MSTSIIAATAATTASINASIAAEQARRAEFAACSVLVSGYEHESATVEQRQSYASCIEVLHPGQLLMVA